MPRILAFVIATVLLLGCSQPNKNEISVAGLEQPVEIIRDQWGINHIYAKNQHDLFFAQGYSAAKDRLFQFEIWRRQATGTVSELLGPRELKRDVGTRLFKYRGNLDEELNYYHEDGAEIIQAYVDGVNRYIEEAVLEDKLPIEFRLLNTKPEKWTAEVVISRHQGLLGNISQELNIGRAVAKVGAETVNGLSWFHPKSPILELDAAIDGELLDENILELYHAYRKPVRFNSDDVVQIDSKSDSTSLAILSRGYRKRVKPLDDWLAIGSNNWVVSGDKTDNGYTLMANDPHRTIAVPSLRYMTHLVAPGWDVIGGGEPEIPGISIGHNEYGAWGLTVFRTDGEDLNVYDLNPENLNQYRYKDTWVDMDVIKETIHIKGAESAVVELRYTRHGPVTLIDSANSKAYAVRCAWLEPGGAPYLASLRMDQAKDWQEFRAACNYSNIPGENMVWAGKDGTIGWQAVGIAPIRPNFSGLVPVPGDGRYEWDGYLPIIEKPGSLNPSKGFISTANQNVTSEDYNHWNAIGFSWADPYRGMRVDEVLESEDVINIEDMKVLQTDYLSIPARMLIPVLMELEFDSEMADMAQSKFADWNFRLEANSVPAAIYSAWENKIRISAMSQFVPKEIDGLVDIQLARILEWIETPEIKFGTKEERDKFLTDAFLEALIALEGRLGDDMTMWQYGQLGNKHIYINHALGGEVDDELRSKLNVGPLPRGGNAFTPGSTGSYLNQSSGASFRLIVNTGDWDATVGTNAPGQSGNPDSEFYKNLFRSWANDEYFPVLYSREKIEHSMAHKTYLVPAKK